MLGAVMPLLSAAGWLWWIYRSDRYEKEPWGLVLQTLGLSAVAGLFGLTVRLLLGGLLTGASSVGGAVVGSLILLPFHLLGIAGVMYRLPFASPHWNEPFDGLVYGSAAGIGYGLIYTVAPLLDSALLGFRIAIFSIPVFMLSGVIIGHAMSRAKLGPPLKRRRNWLRGLTLAALFLTIIEVAQASGGQVVAGNMLAGMLAYGSNTLGWILALEAMAQNRTQPPLGPIRRRLPLAPVACAHCAAPRLVSALYCYVCGRPVGPPWEVRQP